MFATDSQKRVFRFAPSPNGLLHLGHAYSAMLNFDMAKACGGHFLLRIEDIDFARCTPQFEAAIYQDLAWLGLVWEQPVLRQSEHVAIYREALRGLIERDLAYPAFMTRGEVKARVSASEGRGELWPRDPDGAPHYPSEDRTLTETERRRRIESGAQHAWRLDVAKAMGIISAPLSWVETGDGKKGEIAADATAWGDVVLWRSDAPSSYHLSVVVDDAAQGVTHVVRGLDLFHSTSVHRLLQQLLGLPQPQYHHHRLILTEEGRKLSKSERDTGLSALREAGVPPSAVRRLVGL